MRQGLQYHIDLIDGSFGRGMGVAEKQTRGLDSAMGKLNNTIKTAAIAFLGSQLFAVGEQAVMTTTKAQGLERAILFTGGKQGAANLEFVRNNANRLGLDLMTAEKGYTVLSGAMMGNIVLAKEQNNIYEGVSMAMTALNRDSEAFEGSLLAISQMASKGTVSAEELRGQLGERLPGAFGIAARAMGMTEAALGKAMQKGEVMASVFLPRFAQELKNTFGGEAERNSNSFVAQMNRNTTAILQQEVALGEALQPAYLQWQQLQITGMGLLASTATFLSQNSDAIYALATGLGVAAIAYAGVIGLQKASAMYSALEFTWGMIKLGMIEASTLGLTGMAAAQHALNVAMNANPIGLIITAVGLLATGIAYAYQKSEKFRAGISAVLAMVKVAAGPIIGLGKGLVGLFTMDMALVKEGAKDLLNTYNPMAYAKAAKDAYNGKLAEEEAKSKTGLGKGNVFSGSMQGATLPTATAGTGVKSSGTNSVAAGNSVRNVNVTIQNLVRELNVHAGNMKSGASQVRKEIEQALIAATRDYEQALD